MASSPLDNISSRAAMEGMSPQSGKETHMSESVLAKTGPKMGPAQPGESLHARAMPDENGCAANMGMAVRKLAKDHGKSRGR